jgi:hypothetical protein
MHGDITKEFMRTINEYIQTVRNAAGAGTGSGSGPGPVFDPLVIKLDSDGFPILPSPPSWDKFTKDQLEKMYRSYISLHYSKYSLYAGTFY